MSGELARAVRLVNDMDLRIEPHHPGLAVGAWWFGVALPHPVNDRHHAFTAQDAAAPIPQRGKDG